ncbi:MAG: type II CAAX prenyl endopeptidase Rce1 family protein [Erysipelotrichaceae bacterium]
MLSEKRNYGKWSVITFFVTVIVLSAIVEYQICTGGEGWLYLLLMWLPAIGSIAANIVYFIEKREKFSIRKFFNYGGFKLCKIRYVLMGVLLPFIYIMLPYIFYWFMYPDNFAYSGVNIALVLKDLLPVIVVGTVVNLISAAGEEIGWRGCMAPMLYEKLGLKKTLIVSSLFWCLWHLPLIIGGAYMSGTPLWYQIIAFILCIFPVGVMCGLLALKSESMFPSAFLHAAHNNLDQGVFGLITRGDNMMYFVSETGIFTIIIGWTLAILMYLSVKKADTNVLNK